MKRKDKKKGEREGDDGYIKQREVLELGDLWRDLHEAIASHLGKTNHIQRGER